MSSYRVSNRQRRGNEARHCETAEADTYHISADSKGHDPAIIQANNRSFRPGPDGTVIGMTWEISEVRQEPDPDCADYEREAYPTHGAFPRPFGLTAI